MALTQVAGGMIASVAASTLTGTQTIPRGTLPTGSVLQVVQASASSTSTTSTTFVTTGLAASITPTSSTSKILIIVSLNSMAVNTANKNGTSTIYRGATNLALSGSGIAQCFASNYAASSSSTFNQTYSYLDSPATTSSTTYTIYFATETGTTFTMGVNSTTSSMQIMEISA